MLWIDRKAAVETSPPASASKTIAASSRVRRRAAHVLAHIEAGEAEAGGQPQRLDRETSSSSQRAECGASSAAAKARAASSSAR